jgi:hypothetical protein
VSAMAAPTALKIFNGGDYKGCEVQAGAGEEPVEEGGRYCTCPLWQQTAQPLSALLPPAGPTPAPRAPVFTARGSRLASGPP